MFSLRRDIEGLFSKPVESKKHGKELNFLHQKQERQDNRSQELAPPPYKESHSPLSLLRRVPLLLDDFDQEQLILRQERETPRRPALGYDQILNI